MKDLHETFIKMYYQKYFLSFYLDEIRKKGYNINESQYVKGKLELIEKYTDEIAYKILNNTIREKTNRRLGKIVTGLECLEEILSCPDDYKLVVDLDNLEEDNISNALVFIEKRGKFCYFKHKNECEMGFSYKNENWKSI